MNSISIGDESEFRLDGLFDDFKFEFYKLIIKERLYGDIATIELRIMTNEELPEIGTKFSGFLLSSGGRKNEFNCYLYEITAQPAEYVLKFLCCDPTFTRNTAIDSYSNIDDAIKYSSKGFPRLDSIKTDLLSLDEPYKLHQLNQTNYHFCTKLCWMYRYNTVFGYNLDGLRFIDLQSSDMDHPVGDPIRDRIDVKLSNPSVWFNSKYYGLTVEDLDYQDDPHHQIVSYYNKIVQFDTPYRDFIANYLHNIRLRELKNTNSFLMPRIQDYQVGDCIDLQSEQFDYGKCIISARIIELERSQPKITYSIQSI